VTPNLPAAVLYFLDQSSLMSDIHLQDFASYQGFSEVTLYNQIESQSFIIAIIIQFSLDSIFTCKVGAQTMQSEANTRPRYIACTGDCNNLDLTNLQDHETQRPHPLHREFLPQPHG
jgi:hypothetical protein